MTAVLAGSGAAFWACVLAASIYGAVCAVRIWRAASKPPARETSPSAAPGPGPLPGPSVPPPHDAQPSRGLRAPATAGRIDVRLLGRCVATANFYDSGATVTYDHVQGRRHIDLPSMDDDIRDFLSGEAAP